MDTERKIDVKKRYGRKCDGGRRGVKKKFQSSATENEDDDGENVVVAHIPSPSTVSAMLSEVEEMCYKFNILIAACTIRRAKREIELDRSVRRGGKMGRKARRITHGIFFLQRC